MATKARALIRRPERSKLGRTIETVHAVSLWLTLCDPNQLESAILNLSINARDTMPDGGELTTETSNVHVDAAYAARLREMQPGQYICICVSDLVGEILRDRIIRCWRLPMSPRAPDTCNPTSIWTF
jgi:signal transduction histidine kinase